MEDPPDRRRSQARRGLVNPGRSRSREDPPDRRRSQTSRSLVTPGRSRSRDRSRSPVNERKSKRLQLLQQEVQRERERLRIFDRRSPSGQRRSHDRRSNNREVSRSPRRAEQPRGDHGDLAAGAEHRGDAGKNKRSRNLTEIEELSQLFEIMKKFQSSSPSRDARSSQKVDHMNILPNFDPSAKNQRIDVWLRKVNECATVYGWDDRITTHFAMQKLQGLAKTWYEGLNSLLFTWPQWQVKLASAFPYEQNYGQVLEDMLKRKSNYNEPIENYFYDKLALLNQCDIEGKRAVDCIIHGISDRSLKSSALALRCSHPDQLLQFLISSKDSYQPSDKNQSKNKSDDVNSNQSNSKPGGKSGQSKGCYNCKEKGHSFLHCPKPLLKCTQCNRVGHLAEKCFSKGENKPNTSGQPSKTMCVVVEQKVEANQSSKFVKEVVINGMPMQGFVDFGSEVTILKESVVNKLGLTHDNTSSNMIGFGNSIVQSLGSLSLCISIDGVDAQVLCKVVGDHLLEKSVLIGQSYTEQPHIVVVKTSSKLQFINISNEMPHSDLSSETDSSMKVRTSNSLKLYGPASVRATADSSFDGYLLLKSSVAGKPNQQYLVNGGLHVSKNGTLFVLVAPCSGTCEISKGTILSRAERVDIVNRVVIEPPEIPTVVNESQLDESKIRVGDQVSDDVRQRLFELLRKYSHCFATSLKDLGSTNAAEMSIELNSQRRIVYRPYRLSHHERDKVREMVAEMLDAGIVRESISEYSSPIILVRKKDGSLRMCVDYRMLNSITVKERYPMPIIEDEIARLSGQACFVSLDLASGYYQVPISEQCRHLTSFVTPDGQYEFNRMPFGLANAPAVFQRMINSILGSARFTKATAYIDDVLIFGKNQDECLERLEDVLKMMSEANLTLNLSKCDFLRDRIDYLGYEISAEGVRPAEKKIQSVMNFPTPENVHNVRQFLGLASYFRKFIEGFARIATPLNKLLKQDVPWEWGDSQQKAFEYLKSRLVERPILAIYDPEAETELHTDASRLGLGGILLQRSKGSDSFSPVAFYSRQTSPEEKNFHSYELETLAVICSLRKFRVYLLGKQFKVVTDCSALRSTFAKRDLIPRIARWWLLLQEFQCTVEYRAGVKMGHVDALSRNPVVASDELVEQGSSVMSITDDDWLHTLQLGDTELCRIRDILSSDIDEKGLRYIKENYTIRDNKLYRYLNGDKNDVRWVVPKGARWQLCRMNHDDIGHFGVEKTLDRFRKTYWFSKMAKFVKKYVESCMHCAYAKRNSDSHEGLLHPINKVEAPFHTLHVDHLGPFVKSKRGFAYLFVMIDGFTKFCLIKPVRNTNSQNAIRALDEIFCIFKTPERIISDRGSCFTSHSFKLFCIDNGVKHVRNAVASPRSNGQVERYNRTILDSLRAMTVKCGEKDWDSYIGKIQWGLNNTTQKTTGRTPSEVLFGTHMNGEVNPMLNEVTETTREDCDVTTLRKQVKDRIDVEQGKQKLRYDKNRKPAREYVVGDLVKITRTCFNNDGQSKKLLLPYVGPYRVTKALGNDRYEVAPVPGLQSTNNKRPTVVAVDRMMPWIHIAALEVEDQKSESDISDADES